MLQFKCLRVLVCFFFPYPHPLLNLFASLQKVNCIVGQRKLMVQSLGRHSERIFKKLNLISDLQLSHLYYAHMSVVQNNKASLCRRKLIWKQMERKINASAIIGLFRIWFLKLHYIQIFVVVRIYCSYLQSYPICNMFL